jgi:pimeloyl-ACP methyl ester carboxylesterase
MCITKRLIALAFLSITCFATIPAKADRCYLFLSCAPDKQFHPVTCNNGNCKNAADGGDAVSPVTMYIENHGWDAYSYNKNPDMLRPIEFYRAWLEFNDAGHAFGSEQKTAILQKIAELGQSNRPVFIVVYIHGWHHNADNSEPERNPSSNAVKFDYFMARQADQIRRLFEQRGIATTPTVLGIYVGWRGDSLTTPGLKYTTIGNRAEAANRLAANRSEPDDLYRSLIEIAQALHKTDSHGRMIVVGHSLGGRIVTRLFMEDIAKGKVQPLGKNSLLVALEPAVGADCYDHTLGPQHAGTLAPPTFISVTSQSDDSVGWIYQKGSFIIPDCDSASPAHGLTIGNYDDYMTHKITYEHRKRPDDKVKAAALLGAFPPVNTPENWFSSLGKKTVTYKMRDLHCPYKDVSKCYDPRSLDIYTMDFSALKNIQHAGPVWNVLTDKSVIDLIHDPDTLSSRHNGYISTNLTRALIEILYANSP